VPAARLTGRLIHFVLGLPLDRVPSIVRSMVKPCPCHDVCNLPVLVVSADVIDGQVKRNQSFLKKLSAGAGVRVHGWAGVYGVYPRNPYVSTSLNTCVRTDRGPDGAVKGET